MNSKLRLIISGVIAFCFYFAWAYWANSSIHIAPELTFKSALVQGLYSGIITFGFTLLLEQANQKLSNRCLSLAFMVPVLCAVHSSTTQASAMRSAMNDALALSAKKAAGTCLPGVILAPLLPITVQSGLVIGVNMLNQTPNLWLTVAPSIVFSSIYAYSYSITLWRSGQLNQNI